MSISTEKSDDGKTYTIKINGKFDFNLHNDFRKSYKDVEIKSGVYHVDLGKTDYLDSSALGMLLLLKEHAEASSASVKIVNASKEIKDIFIIASFDKLFDIA